MFEEHKATLSDIQLQDDIMDGAARKIIKLKPEWIDVCIAGCRLYLVVCDQLGGEIPELRFVHNNRPVKLSFSLRQQSDDQDFISNEVDIEKQKAIVEAMLDVAEANPEGHTLLDLAICSGRLFMTGHDNLAPTINRLCFRFDKKNYAMNLINGG